MKAKRAVPFVHLAVCALLAAAFANGAQAQAGPAQNLLDGKVVGNLGGFIVGTDLKASLNGSTVNNPDVDFDKTFGDADNTRIRADLLWRVTPHHHLRFLYFDDSTSRRRVIDEDIVWGDHTFTAGGEVRSKNSFKIYELAYEYAFIRQPSFELNGTLGVHWMDLAIKLSGDAIVTDENGNSTSVSGSGKKGSVSAPLPVLGLRAGWVVAPNVYLDAQAQYFKAKINGYDGRVTDLRAGATYMFTPNLGLGIGYNRFTTRVESEKERFDGRIRFAYSGFQAYLTGAF
jgi:hypothetical protein